MLVVGLVHWVISNQLFQQNHKKKNFCFSKLDELMDYLQHGPDVNEANENLNIT
jgi:hypothetical protein